MDLPRLYALEAYWQRHPPAHLLIAAYMGIKPEGAQPAAVPGNENAGLEALFAVAGELPEHLKINIPKAPPWVTKTSNTA